MASTPQPERSNIIRIVIDTQHDTSIQPQTGHGPRPIDLCSVTRGLRRRIGDHRATSYLHGKTRMRDEVMDMLQCSALRAECLVDSMEARGHVSFSRHRRLAGDPRGGVWKLVPRP